MGDVGSARTMNHDDDDGDEGSPVAFDVDMSLDAAMPLVASNRS